MLIIKALGIWLVMVIAAVLNGGFREKILNPNLSESLSLPISGMILSLLIGAIVYACFGFIKGQGTTTYLLIGLMWVSMTLVFEYGFGLAQGMSVSQISQVFNVAKGNLFSLVLLVTLLAPMVVSFLKK